MLNDSLARVSTLRCALRAMDAQTYNAATNVTALQRRRNHLSATLAQLKSLEEVRPADNSIRHQHRCRSSPASPPPLSLVQVASVCYDTVDWHGRFECISSAM